MFMNSFKQVKGRKENFVNFYEVVVKTRAYIFESASEAEVHEELDL